MRNLIQIARSYFPATTDGLPLTAVAWALPRSFICTFGPSTENAVIVLKRIQEGHGSHAHQQKTIASWDAPCPNPDMSCDEVLSLHHFEDFVCLVLAGGDIVVVREEVSPAGNDIPNHDRTLSPQPDKIEIVGSVDAGIAAAQWSPDGELLAIATKADTFILMTRDFDAIVNVAMLVEDLQSSNQVSVGWGKAETQFKGKGAKAMRDPTVPDKVDEGTLSEHDTGRVKISWRGDGQYLALSSRQFESRRVIRVFSREGVLDSVSEPVNGLEEALSWRPSGNLIAAIQRRSDYIDVIFFERNGLRHGEFSLRLTAEEMHLTTEIQIEWNTDSTVLAVCFEDRVQLWTVGNYHYYLKQDISTDRLRSGQIATLIEWHPEEPLSLLLPHEDSVERLEYGLISSRGSVIAPYDKGAVAVIDGTLLKLTPLRLANVPPPMALCEWKGDFNLKDVAFSQTGERIAVCGSEGIDILKWELHKKSNFNATRIGHRPWKTGPSKEIPQQVCMTEDTHLFVLSSDLQGSQITSFDIEKGNGIQAEDQQYQPCRFKHGCTRLFASCDHTTICIETDSNVVMESEVGLPLLKFREIACFPARTPWVEVIHHNGTSIAFGLSKSGSLFANERTIMTNCTSFAVTSSHLIVITTQHLLKFVHLANVEKLEIPLDSPDGDERCRSVERGARIVTVMPTSYAVVLQMPRGNLETIYPRALVLAGIRQSIERRDYRTAFLACRSHRVDMNILHDHTPSSFMSSIELFIDQVKSVEYIDLFLSQLREEDVSRTLYKDTIPATDHSSETLEHWVAEAGAQSGGPLVAHNDTKVNRICDGFLAILEKRTPNHTQNVITAHVCKSPPDLDAGLLVVDSLRIKESALAEKAIEHICFLVDVNKLYDNALGQYNLDITLMVAQQSQKDPREYLPFLQSLEELSELRRRFTIDNHLGRFSKSLKHLYELDAFEELKQFASSKGLLKEALRIYRYSPARYDEIMGLYADHLNSVSEFREAGIAYEYLARFSSAADAYHAAGSWRECFVCASLASYPAEKVAEMATSLAESLVESKAYQDAAIIYLQYLRDLGSAVKILCRGFFFAEAMRVAVVESRPDLHQNLIDPGLLEGLVSSTELLAECKGQINAQVPRLRELRTKKEDDPLAFYDGPTTADGDVPDNISLANTSLSTAGGSLFTRYTNASGTGTLATSATRRTSKNRRREERKRARGKKGSVYEEEYLVNSIARLMERVETVREDVGRLRDGLVRRQMREQARAVEGAMMEVLDLCRGCAAEVFGAQKSVGDKGGPRIGDGNGNGDGGELKDERRKVGGPEGIVLESLDSRGRTVAPVLGTFDRLSLLHS